VSDSTNNENNSSELTKEQQQGSGKQEPGKKRSFFQRFRRQKEDEGGTVETGMAEKDLAETQAEENLVVESPAVEGHIKENPVTENQEQESQSLEPQKTSNLISGIQVSEPSLDAGQTEVEKPKAGLRARFRQALSKTGRSFGNLFLGEREIDDELLEELETLLLLADVGIESTVEIIQDLADRVKRRELADSRALVAALQNAMVEKLIGCEQPLLIDEKKAVDQQKVPFVLLVVGVNGVGKTTTIGKLAKSYKDQGKSVMLAAGDTFRAAAVEQLQTWGERNNVPVVAQHTGADSASVIYDAIESAKSRNIDILIADTAGRLHTKSNLMEELKKVKRVMAKLDDSAPHEVLLVLDAGTGQNAVNQMKEFNDTVNVTGVALTKLDGTAKGGIIFSLCKQFGTPIRYVGLGEGVDDLQPFRAKDYVQALFDQDGKGY
jgi:fused signal recognition particle receptor